MRFQVRFGLCSVPRLFQRIDDRVLGSMQTKPAPVRALFKHGQRFSLSS